MARIRRANSRKSLAEGKPSLGMGYNLFTGVSISVGVPTDKGYLYLELSIEEFDNLATFVAKHRSTYLA